MPQFARTYATPDRHEAYRTVIGRQSTQRTRTPSGYKMAKMKVAVDSATQRAVAEQIGEPFESA
jgi:hypothetical protein